MSGVEGAWSVSWSPSGSRAVLLAKSGTYLLDTAGPSVQRLEIDPWAAPVFWSEAELFWEHGGRWQVRNLETGTDRLLHDFGASVIHFARPGDVRYVANREQGVVQQGYRFGTIVTGEMGGGAEKALIDTGHLIGRMVNGQVLAVEGYRAGPLWAVTPAGEKRLLSKEDAYFVQISPGGGRALWLTRSAEKSSWRDLAGPARAHADPPYDPPLTDLWTWDGSGAPVRMPLGGSFSVQARFSPDGRHIALALNPEFSETAQAEGPGRLAVMTEKRLRHLAAFDGPVGLGIWLGADSFRYSPPLRERTGGQAPIFGISLGGEQQAGTGLWWEAQSRDGRSLIVNWKGDLTTVNWSDSARTAHIHFNPNDDLGSPLYAPATAPYLPFVGGDKVWLKRLTR